MAQSKAAELVEFIAKAIVSDRDAVHVHEQEGQTLELETAQADRGRVIGRQGRVAKAMRAGQVSMTLLDQNAFSHLDHIGERVRSGIDRAFETAGMAGRTTGMGSLLRVHFTDREVRDYRSAYPRPDEAKKFAAFHRALLNRGVLAANNGLMALSTVMSDEDADEIVSACELAVQDVAGMKI